MDTSFLTNMDALQIARSHTRVDGTAEVVASQNQPTEEDNSFDINRTSIISKNDIRSYLDNMSPDYEQALIIDTKAHELAITKGRYNKDEHWKIDCNWRHKRGVFGICYRASDNNTPTTFFVKEICDKRDYKGFIDEVKMLSVLRHSIIPELFGMLYKPNNYQYILMEFVEGDTLQQIIAEKSLDVAMILKIVKQLLEVIIYCHEKGVVHNDIKPDNIILTTQGFIKLVDWGNAKHSTDATARRLDQTRIWIMLIKCLESTDCWMGIPAGTDILCKLRRDHEPLPPGLDDWVEDLIYMGFGLRDRSQRSTSEMLAIMNDHESDAEEDDIPNAHLDEIIDVLASWAVVDS